MSWCSDHEDAVREAKRQARLRRTGWAIPALLAHDAEHRWREAGEPAIREEMEARVTAWLARCAMKKKGAA
jgi:transposase